MKLRKRQSLVTHLPEEQPPSAVGMRITKLLYIVFLVVLLGYLGYIGLRYLLYEEARGQILIERTQIASTHSGRLVSLPEKAGNRVRKGQVLAELRDDTGCPTAPAIRDERGQRLLLDAQLDQVKLAGLRTRLANADQAIQRIATQRALEIDAPRHADLERTRLEAGQLRSDIALLEQRVALQRMASHAATSQPLPALDCVGETLTAPFDGSVAALHARSHEVLRAGEPILSLLPERPPVLIEIHPSSTAYQHWTAGTRVDVLLPDGRTHTGVVADVRSAAQPRAERIWNNYVPEDATLVVRIRPDSDAAADAWRTLERMEVTVRLSRVTL